MRHRATALLVGVLASLLFSGSPSQAEPPAIWPLSFAPPVSVQFIPGYMAPGTPESLDRVGIIKVGWPFARNVLVLEPGTSAAGAYFLPFARWVAQTLPGWQVWAVVRRESLLEDQSVLNLAKEGKATAREVFNYYLGWLFNPGITNHVALNQYGDTFADEWGMKVAVEDLHRVIGLAHRLGGRVVLGGHSLGGTVVTAYATWNFGGRPGADGLAGLVYDDGGSAPVAPSAEAARAELEELREGTPWLAFGGIPAPFAGLLAVTGAAGTLLEGQAPSPAAPLLAPLGLAPPCNPTNEAQFAYPLNVGTSPPSLIAAQAHLGHLVLPQKAGELCTWSAEGALTPPSRYAEMFFGAGVLGQDGSEWYFPRRLTIDSGAVAEGNANPAQEVLGLEATEGHHLPHYLKILAIDTELDRLLEAQGLPNALQAAEILAAQSHIPRSHLTLINASQRYAHNDPAGAYPNNLFFDALVPFLLRIGGP